ncbi:MAG: glycosyltransferase [Armatimonadia bacterium]|nr:glycosyltransferase [Armatimonadia bacterium]
MKVCIAAKSGDWSAATTGKGFFAARLAAEMKSLGAKVTADTSEKVDVALHIGHIHYKSHARKDVLRLGPARVSTHENMSKLNAAKAKSVKIADGIVFQSEYSRRVMRKFVAKPPRKSTVVYNGVNYDWYDECVAAKDLPHKVVFVASTRKWIPQKRLKDVVLSFKAADIKDSALYVLGNPLEFNHKKHGADNIHFAGNCDQIEIASYLKAATAMVHAVYLDACPNSVVEAIGAKAPVVCTDQGGTVELLKGWNYIAVQDKPFAWKPVNLAKPPRIDHTVMAGALRMAAETKWGECDRPERCDIGVVANNYLQFFEEVLDG